ncbi:MAG: hypothetical protein U5L96_12040 [Owenweeksia sp.]|nr:hypothetical protein [Owenweeksia sp.]
MKTFTYFILILLSFISFSSEGQTRYGIWYFPSCGNQINGLAFGIWDSTEEDSCKTVVNGLRTEVIGFGFFMAGFIGDIKDEYRGFYEVFKDSTYENSYDRVNGINLSLLGTHDRIRINGLTLTLGSQWTSSINGLQVAAFGNSSLGRVNGAQISLISYNQAVILNGLQLNLLL